METKIDTHTQIRSSFSGGKGTPVRSVQKNINANSAKTTKKTNSDTFSMSSQPVEDNLSKEKMDELKMFSENAKKAKQMETLNLNWANDDYASRTKFNFEKINYSVKCTNESISKKLEEAGVPKDVTFEFDFNFDSKEIEIVEISDEKYRESVKNAMTKMGTFNVISCASRVMNGHISSLYYPYISNALKNCFDQDINNLYIDENNNLCGVNKNLQKAIENSKRGKDFYIDLQNFFPAKNIEGIVKRLVSDENITPNISRIGYDGESIYTNDGEFKLGKDFNPDLFDEEKYIIRGTTAFFMSFYGHMDSWLENEEKFY